jgi:hypothetical protein
VGARGVGKTTFLIEVYHSQQLHSALEYRPSDEFEPLYSQRSAHLKPQRE